MAYDLEEQEQLDALKAWWKQFGNLITWVLIAALGAFAGWSSWNAYLRNQSSQASQLYDGLQKAVAAKDAAKVQRAATDLEEKFGRTAYAPMAGLVAAKSAFDAKDLKTVKSQLQWVIDHGSDEYKAIAKLRLSGVLLDEKAHDNALKLLSGEFPPSFAASVSDRKGDILVAQDKPAEARAAYQLALEKMDKKDPGRQLVQLKLEALGGTAPKAA